MLQNKLIIKQYPTKIPLTKGRQKVYYTSSNIPSKFIDKNTHFLKKGYSWDDKMRLLDKDGKHIIKNQRKLNSPRYFMINFQSIYSGVMHPQTRAKIVKWFHEFWKEELKIDTFKKVIMTEDQALLVFFHYYDIPSNIKPDFIDNFCFLYKKTFMDSIVEEGLLQDDNIMYVRGDENRFYEITDVENRRLEISYKIVDKKTLI